MDCILHRRFWPTDAPENLPIRLKNLNIKDGTVKTVANVGKDGDGNKLDSLAKKLKELESEFKGSIHSIAWSPDSRTLAFAAQIAGLSSDVIYTILNQERSNKQRTRYKAFHGYNGLLMENISFLLIPILGLFIRVCFG